MKKTTSEKSPSPMLKAAAVGGFILLISTFIAYRSGYFDSESPQKVVDVDPQDYLKDSLIKADSLLHQKRIEEEKRMLMYSSKSGVVVDPNKDIHLSSSKSFQVLDKNDLPQDSMDREK